MDAQRDGLAQRQSVLVGPQPLFVNAVACFVQDAKEAGVEEPLLVTRGDPAVVRAHAAAERMGRDVEPAAIEAETDSRRDLAAKGFLPIDGIPAGEQRNVGLSTAGMNRRHQRYERFAQTGQNLRQTRGPLILFVLVEQRIVRMLVLAQRFGLLVLEGNDLFQMRLEQGEVLL